MLDHLSISFVWLAPIADPLKLCLWPFVFSATCCPRGGFPYKAQWAARYHSIAIKRNLPWSGHWTVSTTHYKWNISRLCSGQWFLGIFFRESVLWRYRVLNPFAPSNRHSSLSASYRYHENLKKMHYEQRIREVEHLFYSLGLRYHRWPWPSGCSLLQTPGQYALGQMEATIQHHHWLAKM